MSSLTSDPSFAQPLLGAATQQPITVSSTVTVPNTAIGTTFPGSPTDGQEFCYLADSTNGVVWRFKYRSGSASTYKWECIGGLPLFSEVLTDESTTSTTYAALATAGPSVVAPLAGDYDVRIGGLQYNVNTNGYMSYDIGVTGAVDNDAMIQGSGGGSQTGSRLRRKTALSAGTNLVAKYKTISGTMHWQTRWMEVKPVRVIG